MVAHMAERKLNGLTVRALREALGIPHGHFANDIQVSAGYLTNIEIKGRQPSPAVVRAIADRLGVSVDAITYPDPSSAKKVIAPLTAISA